MSKKATSNQAVELGSVQLAQPAPRTIKLRYKDAAKFLGVSLHTLRRRIRRGEIGHEDLGYHNKYVYVAELEGYLKRRQKNFHVQI